MAAALTREQVAERLEPVKDRILALGVQRLALFGSIARNEARSTSDIDLVVEFEPGQKSYTRFLDLADLLEETLGTRVDLVTAEALSPYLGPHILAEAADVVRAA